MCVEKRSKIAWNKFHRQQKIRSILYNSVDSVCILRKNKFKSNVKRSLSRPC